MFGWLFCVFCLLFALLCLVGLLFAGLSLRAVTLFGSVIGISVDSACVCRLQVVCGGELLAVL